VISRVPEVHDQINAQSKSYSDTSSSKVKPLSE